MICNRFTTSIPTLKITDIMKTKDCSIKIKGMDFRNETNPNLIKELVIGSNCKSNTHCHLLISNFEILSISTFTFKTLQYQYPNQNNIMNTILIFLQSKHSI